MYRKILAILLSLSLGLGPMANVWAGQLSAAETAGKDAMMLARGHAHHELASVAHEGHAMTMHCHKSGHEHGPCHCGADCCGSGHCAHCGHCAAALIEIVTVAPSAEPHGAPIFSLCFPESNICTPPYRPPVSFPG